MTEPNERQRPPQELLFHETMNTLSAFFEANSHRPSTDQWGALEDLAKHLQLAADARLEKCFYLSSLDPGIGKSQTIVHFLRALTSYPMYREVGAIVCLSTKDEIKNMIQELQLAPAAVAVLTSDDAVNALTEGNLNPDKAQVILTTQQRIEWHLKGKAFESADEFYFNGKPRSVRIWDESYLPGNTLTLSVDDIAFVLKAIRHSYPKLTEALFEMVFKAHKTRDGRLLAIPDYPTEFDIDLNRVLSLFDTFKDNSDKMTKADQRAAITSLWSLAGRNVRIRRDGKYGNTMLDFEDTIPEDMAPMIITDASGRVRHSYRQIEKGRKNLTFLKTATKRYDNLTVHVWQRGGGKSAFEQHGRKLVDGIAETIREHPDDEWLIVTHKPSKRVGDVPKKITSALNGDVRGVKYLTWGNHRATNAFKNCKRLMLAGTLFYKTSYYEALARLSLAKRAEAGVLSKAERELTEMGEHRHLLLQALCRGAVRKSDGDGCHPMDAYIICSVRSGIKEALQEIFPGCQVVDWKPVLDDLEGPVKNAFESIKTWFEFAEPRERLKFKTVAENLCMTPKRFKDAIRRDTGFREALASEGIVEHGDGIYMTAYTRAADAV